MRTYVLAFWLLLALTFSACQTSQPESAPSAAPTGPAVPEPAPGFLEQWFGNLFTLEGKAKEKQLEAIPEPTAAPTPPPKAKQEQWTLMGWAMNLFESGGSATSMESLKETKAGDEAAQKRRIQEYIQAKLSNISTIYVQSFTGENLDEVRKGLYAAIKGQGKYKIEEILPDHTEGMAVLRIKVEDFSIWDNEERFEVPNLDQYTEETKLLLPEKIVRRNALVGVRLALFDAETGMPLVRGRYSQPFQQIYVGQDIGNMPKPGKEMERLTQILITKILNAFNAKETDLFSGMELERGTDWGWLAENLHDPGDQRIMKGLKLAKVGKLDQAIGLWKLVLYAPEGEEPAEIYRVNRAAAYYNLGVVYQLQGDRLFAAKMFSQANRLIQKLKYAQAWGDNIHAWLDQKSRRNSSDGIEIVVPEPKPPAPPKRKPEVVELLESNPNLLLRAQELWPLEPVIKNADPEDLNGTQRGKLDLPSKRFDRKGYINYGDDDGALPLPKKKAQPNPAAPSANLPLAPELEQNSLIQPAN